MAASPSQAASVCQTTQFDDLSPRTDFPLPIGPGNVSDVVNGLWSDADAYRTVVFNRWINQVNQNRCWSHPADPTYCRYSSELAPLRQRINVAAPGYAALELVDQPGRCLNVGTITSYVSAQPCPSRPTDAGFFVKWDPVQQTLVSEEPNRCVYAMRTATTTPGFAIVGLAVCGATNNQEDISRTWTFRDSTDAGGRWDNTGAYLVVADRSTPSQLNSCLDSYSPTSTWVAPCTQPKRVRIWMAKPGT